MSLIERALSRAKEPGTPAAAATAAAPVAPVTAAAPVRRPAAQSPPPPRRHADPQLRLTPEMATRLGLLTPPEVQHQRDSEFRQVKRTLVEAIRATPDANRMILVASALAGEGKSYSAANLARLIALEPDYSVLLVDADVIKPHVSRSLGLYERPGLVDALVDPTCDVESLVLTTDIDGLSVLPAGSAHANATELFASEQMRHVMGQLLSVPNRIIVVDSLPLLLTTEARSLAPLAGQVLLVVRAESTPQSAVVQAVDLLGQGIDVKLVLNAVSRNALTRYLGYGYGYSYDYASQQKARP